MAAKRVTPKQFYVYTHSRPDGSLFYIGKGHGRRARDFSPSRRSAHHRNLALKHGLRNIIVEIIPCESEAAAFALECQMIQECVIVGVALINRTLGGEGTSGRPMSAATQAAFAKGRGREFYQSLSAATKATILEALARGREKNRGRILTPEEHETRSRAAKRASATRLAKPGSPHTCAQCGAPFETNQPAAVYCHKRCGVRASRARKLALFGKPAPKPRGPQSPEARARVGAAQRERWAKMSELEREAWKARVRPGQQGANDRRRRTALDKRGIPSQTRISFEEEG